MTLKFLQSFSAKEAKQFGLNLANYYLQRALKDDSGKRSKVIVRKQQELLTKIYQQLASFMVASKPNFYQLAQMGNTFKWHLLDHKIEKSHADEITEWLMLQAKNIRKAS